MTGRASTRPVQGMEECGFAGDGVHESSKTCPTRIFPDISKRVPLRLEPSDLGSPCMVWTGNVDRQGYAMTTRNTRHQRVHRILWDRLRGPRPDGSVIHHRCEVKLCLNIDHMELVGRGDHVRIHRAGKPLVGGRPGHSEDTTSEDSQ